MNCEILDTLYIRANGDIPCDDDAGERIILAHAGAADWSLHSTLRNAAYAHIRESLSKGQAPWPDTCPSCAFFRPQQPFSSSHQRRELRKVQIEPSLACNLRCPCCNQLEQIHTRPRPFLMSPRLFEKVLAETRAAGFAIREIEYCGQGEPLMNRDFPTFVRLARRYHPEARQRLITNGNFDYASATGGEALDEIFVSCDGARQSSYEQYRAGGRIDRVFDFIKAVPGKPGGRSQRVVWKYILFEFNDSDDEIREAQERAQELGVDTLLFVFTHSRFKSQRFTVANALDIPILYSNVAVNATPMHYERAWRALKPLTIWLGPAAHPRTGTLFKIDEVTLAGEQNLAIRGWVLSKKKIDSLLIHIGDRLAGAAQMNQARPDVYQALPGYGEKNSGFIFATELAGQIADRIVISAELMSGARPVTSFIRSYSG